MEKYLKQLEDTLSKGDPTVRSWFLIQNNYIPIVISGLYVLISTVIGPALMRNRKPFDLRIFMIVFNLFLVAVYVVCFSIFIWNLQYTDFKFFCEENVAKKGNLAYMFAEVSWVIYMLKYVELLDTVVFVLRKKQNQVSFLHVMHHAALPVLIWLNFRMETAGIQLVILYLNAFVHIVMYSYYGLAAMGPSVRKYLWWKKYITQLQIIQFILVILLATVIVPLSGCGIRVLPYFVNLIFAPLFLYLFFKFYMDNYQTRKTTKELYKTNKENVENDKRYLNGIAEEKID